MVLNKHPLGLRPISLLFPWTRESLLHTMDLTKQQYLLSPENGLYILFLWYQLCLLLFTIKSLARCSRDCGIFGLFQIKHLLFLSYLGNTSPVWIVPLSSHMWCSWLQAITHQTHCEKMTLGLKKEMPQISKITWSV